MSIMSLSPYSPFSIANFCTLIQPFPNLLRYRCPGPDNEARKLELPLMNARLRRQEKPLPYPNRIGQHHDKQAINPENESEYTVDKVPLSHHVCLFLGRVVQETGSRSLRSIDSKDHLQDGVSPTLSASNISSARLQSSLVSIS